MPSNGSNTDRARTCSPAKPRQTIPVLALFETPGYKQGRNFDKPIDLSIIHEKGALKTVELLLQTASRKIGEGEDIESVWAATPLQKTT